MKTILFILLVVPFAVNAQKTAVCTIYLPQTLKKELLNIYYHNGKERKYVDVKSNNDSIVVHDTYYSQHLILFMGYTGVTPMQGYTALFYVGERPATIRLADRDSSQNVFSNIQVKNALDASTLGFKQMNQYISNEHDRVYAAYNRMMASPSNDAIKDTLEMLVSIELTKKMDYIR